MTKSYVLYDGRAESGDTDEACVLEAFRASTLESTVRFWKGADAVLVEYDLVDDELRNEKIIGHLRESVSTLIGKCNK